MGDPDRLLQADATASLGPMRLGEDLTPAELEQSTFLTNARLLLGKLKESEQRATAKGNLNRDFVRVMAAEMRMPQRYQEWQRYIKVTREADVWPLDELRMVLRVAAIRQDLSGGGCLASAHPSHRLAGGRAHPQVQGRVPDHAAGP
jgi:hypothetical protein